jgi:hypothetical protein
MPISAIRRRDQYGRHLATLTLLIAAGLAIAVPARAESDAPDDSISALAASNAPRDSAVEDRLARLESELAQVKQQTISLHATQSDTSEELGHMRAGLANAEIGLQSLRSSIDESDPHGRQAAAALGRRVEHLEHLIATGDSTGSISGTAARRRAHPVVPNWSVREVADGKAVIAGKGATWQVGPGSVIPGLGRVSTVRQRANRWVVMTDKGAIVQR